MTGSGARILVVDDEPEILRAVRTNLSKHGYQIDTAANGKQALEAFNRRRPDLLLVDLGLPDMDGLEVIRTVREQASTPVIVLSVREAEHDKIGALDLGADDYLTKPFSVEELRARIRVALRHSAHPDAGSSAVFRTGELEVDFEHRIVRVAGQEIHLSPTEYDLLRVFCVHPNKVLTHRMLLQQVWGNEYGSERYYLHAYLARLRKKIEPDSQNPRYLVTEPGVGYRLLA
ncbi:MAG: response regulator transcription factor [Chloroflexi bacterium]|nr:response regulator transcription factor [Chloroflexota bacterium]MCL5108928.1 response regulator transcription factor [Chloroflexota bacterium]